MLTKSPTILSIPGINPPTYLVKIPEGDHDGGQFLLTIHGTQIFVTCPMMDVQPGMEVRIIPPTLLNKISQLPLTDTHGVDNESCTKKNDRQNNKKAILVGVTIPNVFQMETPFACTLGTVRILATCPFDTGKTHIKLTIYLPLVPKNKSNNSSAQFQLNPGDNKHCWTRMVRANDLHFQWVRFDDNSDVDWNGSRFNFEKSAYVRKLEYLPAGNTRRTGILSWIPASEAVVNTTMKSRDGKRFVVIYLDLIEAQHMNFDNKVKWFRDTCTRCCVEWDNKKDDHIQLKVRRENLVEDSIRAVMALTRDDLHKLWTFHFCGETCMDFEGMRRQWFQLVCGALFDPNVGLWIRSLTNPTMSMTINPDSAFYCENHLVYYRFLGRVIGKAMLDGHHINRHMDKYIYKHMLGWPIQLKDLESVDKDYYRMSKQLQEMAQNGEDLSSLCLDFTTTTEIMGVKEVVELVEGGADKEVTNDNFPEYLEACLKYKLMDCVKPQLTELLMGVFDVIPEPLLTIFDFQELELLMCGLPEIDMEDWKNHTEYSGEYDGIGQEHPTCQWFWEVVTEFDRETRARLLQFVTGTSGVPSRGFGVLHGSDKNIQKFTIHGIRADECLYPRAHPCVNRIDLPPYESKMDLQEKLSLAVAMSSTGFLIE